MEDIYRTAVQKRIEKAKKDLTEKFGKIKDDIKSHMDVHLANGNFGWEFMRDPFLWKDECKEIIEFRKNKGRFQKIYDFN